MLGAAEFGTMRAGGTNLVAIRRSGARRGTSVHIFSTLARPPGRLDEVEGERESLAGWLRLAWE